MPVIERLNTFSPNTRILSAEVNEEFDQIIGLCNGTDAVNSLAIGNELSNSFSPDPKVYVEGQVVFAITVNGTVLRIGKVGAINSSIDFLTSGEIRALAGQESAHPSSQIMILGGALFISSSNVGNVGAGADTLKSFTINGYTISVAGSRGEIHVRAAGRTAANANNKTLSFKVKTTEVINSGAVAFNDKAWFLDVWIHPDLDSVSAVTVTAIFKCDSTEVRNNVQVTGFDFTVDNTCTLLGEGTADNDIYVNQFAVYKDAGTSI